MNKLKKSEKTKVKDREKWKTEQFFFENYFSEIKDKTEAVINAAKVSRICARKDKNIDIK